jgi:hypothetical protein
MLPHQFAKAQKALSFLRYGVPAYQKISLPGCKVEIMPSTAEYGVDIADMIASWVKKGFVSGPFSEPSLNKFRANCLMAVKQGTNVGPILNISLPKNCSFNDTVDEYELKKLKSVRQNLSATQFWRPVKVRKCIKLICGTRTNWYRHESRISNCRVSVS